jgi:hypothetical protein
MKKKISWKEAHKEQLKAFYKIISNYYNEIQNTEEYRLTDNCITIVITRNYTDHLYKCNLHRKQLDAHLHHIIPRACGGTDDPRNLIWLTKPNHCDAHAILYKCNRKNASIRAAATMLRVWARKKEKCLTVGEHRKNASSSQGSIAFYGETSYSWNSD